MTDKSTHVMIDRETLEILVSAAESGLADLVSGLDDGTYEDDCLGGSDSDTIEKAIETAEAVLRD